MADDLREIEIELFPGCTVKVPKTDYSQREAEALRIPEDMLPSEWAERYRVLQEDEAALAGPWSNANAPYLVGIMDMSIKQGVRRLTLKKGVQGGISDAIRNVMGYWAMMDPSPVGLVLPNKEKGEQIVRNKIIPFFRNTPVIRKLFTKSAADIKKGEIRLANNFLMYLMWSGSPASLASNPMKRAVSDETNKFEEWAGKEASPVELTDRRLTTYPDAIHILISSPTTSAGVISVNFEASDVKLYFCVQCPGCGKWQRLVFDNVIIPDELLKMADNNEAAKICNQTQAAHYQCPACEQHIDDRMRRKLIREGKWMTVDPDNKVFADGVIEDAMEIEAFPNETRVGMHISSLYWMWERVTISSIAATYLRAINDPLAMFEFRTGDLGEDADITHAQITLNTFEILSTSAETPESLLPNWTDRILLTVDTQQDHFYATLRAWGSHMISRRVWHGNLQTFEDLTALMCRSWPYQSGWLPAIRPMLMLMDSGGTRTDVNEESSSRTQEVYAYTLKYPAQVIPLKGASKPRDTRDLHWFGRGLHNPHAQNASRRQEIRLLMVDSNQAQDMLDRMINTQIKIIDPFTGEEREDFQQWGLNQANDDTYNRQMTNLHKMMDKVGDKLVERWVPVKDGARHDYRDCEGYQIVAAYLTGVHLIPSLPQWYQIKKEQYRASATSQFIHTPKTPDGREYFANNR